MKKFLFFLLSLIIGFGGVWFVIREVGWQPLFQLFLFVRYWQAFVIIILTLLIALLNVFCWQFILKTQGHSFSLLELSDIWLAGFAISYFTPIAFLGGEAFMSLAFRKKTSLRCKKNISSIIILRILNGSIVLLFSAFGVFVFFVLVGLFFEKIILASIIILGLLSVLAFFYYKSFKGKSILKGFLRIFGERSISKENSIIGIEKDIFTFFKAGNKIIWQGLGIAFIISLLRIFRLWLIVFFLGGIAINIFQVFAIFAFVSIAHFLPIPAALGTLEVSQFFLFGSLELGAEVGTVFSLILRGAHLFLGLIGIFCLIKFWMKFQVFDKILGKIKKIFK